MILTLFFLSALAYSSPIQFDESDPIASHPKMMELANSIYERNVRRGLTLPSQLSAADKTNILNLHNQIRSQTANGEYRFASGLSPQASMMSELKWSDLLEKVSTQWSKRCNFNHRGSGGDSCKSAMSSFGSPEWGSLTGAGCGENLYGSGVEPAWSDTSFGDDMGMKGGIEDSWCIGEAKGWTYGGSMGGAGHYTQVVWDTARYVGCGFSKCSSGWMNMMLTCNYYPAGNGFFGDHSGGPYARGTPCSACPSDIPNCSNGLCTDGGAATPTPRPTVPTPRPTVPTPRPTVPTPRPTVPTPRPTAPTTVGATPEPTQPTPPPTPPPSAPTPPPSAPTPPPTPPPVAGGDDCLTISGFIGNLAILNGVYASQGQDWVTNDFTLTLQQSQYNGFCQGSGCSPDWETYGWCVSRTGIFECDGWSGYSGTAAASASPTFTRSSCDGSTGGGGDGGGVIPGDGTCVRMEQLEINVAAANGQYKSVSTGEWNKMTDDVAGYPCYKWTEGDWYLYALEGHGWYTISDSIGSRSGLRGWCGQSYGTNIDILSCDGQWDLGGVDSNCIFRDCAADAFTFAPCLEDKNLNEGICFYESNEDEKPMEFGILEDEGCLDDQPVYKHTNESDADFYIHYDADNSLWKLSVDFIQSNDIYVCAEENLLQCTEGSWIRLITGFGIQSFEAMESGKVESCEVIVNNGASTTDEGGLSSGYIVLIVILVVLFIVLIIGGIIFYRKNKNNKEVTFDHDGINKEKTTSANITSDKVPMTTEEYDDKHGDTVNIGTDDEDEQL